MKRFLKYKKINSLTEKIFNNLILFFNKNKDKSFKQTYFGVIVCFVTDALNTFLNFSFSIKGHLYYSFCYLSVFKNQEFLRIN